MDPRPRSEKCGCQHRRRSAFGSPLPVPHHGSLADTRSPTRLHGSTTHSPLGRAAFLVISRSISPSRAGAVLRCLLCHASVSERKINKFLFRNRQTRLVATRQRAAGRARCRPARQSWAGKERPVETKARCEIWDVRSTGQARWGGGVPQDVSARLPKGSGNALQDMWEFTEGSLGKTAALQATGVRLQVLLRRRSSVQKVSICELQLRTVKCEVLFVHTI